MNVSIIEKAIEFAKKTFAQDFSGHDYYHTDRIQACNKNSNKGNTYFPFL